MTPDRAATKRARKRERAKPRQQIEGSNNIQAGRDVHINMAASAAKRAR